MNKVIRWGVFGLYIIFLIWVVLFKLAVSYSDILNQIGSQSRNINFIPFGQSNIVNGSIGWKEIIYNIVIFLPFGVLLNVVLKKWSMKKQIMLMFCFSLSMESLQFIFKLGATDITDLLMNTLGGVVGIAIYSLLRRYISENALDRFWIISGLVTLIFLILLIAFLMILNK
ncbi:VanZ family protein [Enterococcus faecalis]